MRYIFEALISIGKDAEDKSNQGWVAFDEVLPDGLAPGVWLMKKISDENREKSEISEKSPNLKFVQAVKIKLSTPEILHVWEELGKAQGILMRCQVCGAEGEQFPGSNSIKMAKWCINHPYCDGRRLERVMPPPPARPAEPIKQETKAESDDHLSTVFTIPEIKAEEEYPGLGDVMVLLEKGNKVIKRKAQKSAFIIDDLGVELSRLMPKDFEALMPLLKPIEHKLPLKGHMIYELIKK